jgi:hypothetical protein
MRIRALVIVTATILAAGPLGARTAGAMVQDFSGGGISAAGRPTITSRAAALGNPSAVTWSSRRNVGANYTWSYGAHLASTSSATKTYLHEVATTDRVGGNWADNNGPYLGVNYVRGNASGSSWGTPFRLNAKAQHGDAAAIAASGKYVYASWYRVMKYINFDPDAPRTLYFRRNTSHGASASWGARQALTSTSGRVGVPALASAGTFVYIAYTDADNGDIRLAISNDRGASWTTSTIGTTTSTGDAFDGAPVVAAAGSNVVVSWTAADDGSVVARVSTTNGSSWDSPTTLAASSTYSSFSASSARDTRIGVTWLAEDGPQFSLWTAGTWGDVRSVGPPNGRVYIYHYQPALVFGAAGQVAVAWGACWANCETFDELTKVDLAWAESKDDGVTWYDPQVVGPGGGSTWRANDAPSVLWPTAGKRIVAWNGYRLGYPYYRMFLKIGSGAN